ncbi:MAG TPA: SDR family oxidoreductase [Pyrinomonadaceae bacterium]|nr:SDR family oxidoreductase [Pyrinomonadaceae bacterium]
MSTILITGGTGFLGKRLGKYFREAGNTVFLTGRNHDQNRAAESYSGCPVIPSDVANIESVRDVFAETSADIVVHAAASKYVDTAEANPMECLDVNIAGSQNVARVAVERKVSTVVGVSTDKAAPPVANTYGLTKAVMERLYCAMDAKAATRFVCVRFGNMPWSTGSAIPIWQRMIEESGEIQSTGSHMTRLFTPVDEAVKLIQTAVDRIDEVRGKVLCRTMKAARIEDFLRVWTERKGGTWRKIAPRAGERDYEHLIGESELEYTRQIHLDGVVHYLIEPNILQAQPLDVLVSSVNAERLSDDEIWEIIKEAPE